MTFLHDCEDDDDAVAEAIVAAVAVAGPPYYSRNVEVAEVPTAW